VREEHDADAREDDDLVVVGDREAPGRYSRTTGGLLAALVVTALLVVAIVVVNSFGKDASFETGPIDYVGPVQQAQDSGVQLVYPAELPKGWVSTSIDFVPGARPAWGIGMLTDDGRFVGIRQEDSDVEDLLAAYVDEHAEPGDESTFDSDLQTGAWQTWADRGGDLAFTATLKGGDRSVLGDTVMIYGSASRDDQEQLISLLTMDDLD
jgi:hypothetical protein